MAWKRMEPYVVCYRPVHGLKARHVKARANGHRVGRFENRIRHPVCL